MKSLCSLLPTPLNANTFVNKVIGFPLLPGSDVEDSDMEEMTTAWSPLACRRRQLQRPSSRARQSRLGQSGDMALYVATEYGYVDLVKEMIKFHDISLAEVWKVLMDAILELSMVCDSLNTTALHIAASHGHIEVVNFLLEKGSSDNVVAIVKSSAKSAMHSAAKSGHVEIVKSLLSTEPGIKTKNCHPTFPLRVRRVWSPSLTSKKLWSSVWV
ncbi:hypothetical protein Dsin_021853 [Dipteronia sinensis]|uniref:Uncharacterized protein n=1 Tax=Dipteronia sinensis TaxID=43782 RepID=A0AAE0A0N8_9ROSI|nr:hypothetical protein Dsin_021853 [Dipteronia sinensis]